MVKNSAQLCNVARREKKREEVRGGRGRELIRCTRENKIKESQKSKKEGLFVLIISGRTQ
jgi:hypothetical protein